MKSYKTHVFLAATLLALGGLAYWDEVQTKKDDEAGHSKDRLTKFAQEDVDILVYTKQSEGKEPFEVTVRKMGDSWQITSPIQAKADENTIDSLLKNTTEYQYEKEITNDPKRYAEFGLDKPGITITLKGGEKAETIMLGNKAPVGFSVYLRKKDTKAVYLGSQTILTAAERTLDDFRDKSLAEFDTDKITKLSYQRKGEPEIQLTKQNAEWHLTKPITDKADDNAMAGLLTALQDENVAGFVDQPTAADQALFANPDITVSWQADKGNTTKLLIVNGKEELLASYDPKLAIFRLGAPFAEKIAKNIEDFRDKRVFNFAARDVQKVKIDGIGYTKKGNSWEQEASAVSKQQAKPADHIKTLLIDLEYAMADEFQDLQAAAELGPPTHRIEIALDEKVRSQNLIIDVWQSKSNPEQMIVRHEDGAHLFVVPKTTFANLTASQKASALGEDVHETL